MTTDRTATFEALKAKQRLLRTGFNEHVGLRVHRVISWLEAAAQLQEDDFDGVFVCHWVAFNAAYAQGADLHRLYPEPSFFKWYFDMIVALDREHVVYDAVWDRFSGLIRTFIDNHYVFQPFWRHQHGESGFDDWRERFQKERGRFLDSFGRQDTAQVLAVLFDRLYVLRNQLLHGGATWHGSVNREQVRAGAHIMAFLVPRFVDLMMDHPDDAWGVPPYPVVAE